MRISLLGCLDECHRSAFSWCQPEDFRVERRAMPFRGILAVISAQIRLATTAPDGPGVRRREANQPGCRVSRTLTEDSD